MQMTPTPPTAPQDPLVTRALNLHAELTACDKVMDELRSRIRGLPLSTPKRYLQSRMDDHISQLGHWRTKRAKIFDDLQRCQKGMPNPPVSIVYLPKTTMRKSTAKFWAHIILIGLACAALAFTISSATWLLHSITDIIL